MLKPGQGQWPMEQASGTFRFGAVLAHLPDRLGASHQVALFELRDRRAASRTCRVDHGRGGAQRRPGRRRPAVSSFILDIGRIKSGGQNMVLPFSF